MDAYERGHSMDSLSKLIETLRNKFEQIGEVDWGTSLVDSRAALFGLQRAYHFEGDGPEPHEMPFIWAVVRAISQAAK
jgi:hypothetical protein